MKVKSVSGSSKFKISVSEINRTGSINIPFKISIPQPRTASRYSLETFGVRCLKILVPIRGRWDWDCEWWRR